MSWQGAQTGLQSCLGWGYHEGRGSAGHGCGEWCGLVAVGVIRGMAAAGEWLR
jgi:hypothetical protein